MLSHAGLALFLLTMAVLLISFAAAHLELSTLGFGPAVQRPQPGTIALQAAGENQGFYAALWMRILVTLAVLASALYIVLSRHYEADQQKWAFGVIGTVLGYWLRP